jgi:uncharacterized membrane protein YkoI
MFALMTVLAAVPAACDREEGEEAEETEEAEEAEEAGQPAQSATDQAALAAQATVDSMTARRTALERVPGGEITAAELEEEDGRLFYSFDIKVPGKEGIEEVHVDARTGAVISVEHESEGGEAAEGPREGAGRTP